MSAKSLEFIQRATNWSDWKVSCVESVYVPHWASLWSSLVILGKKSENMNISDVMALTDQWLNECKINKRRGSRTYGMARGWRRPRPSGWGTRKPRRTARWCASLLFVWFSSSPDASSGAIYPTELPPHPHCLVDRRYTITCWLCTQKNLRTNTAMETNRHY